jgi:hypothetical protein
MRARVEQSSSRIGVCVGGGEMRGLVLYDFESKRATEREGEKETSVLSMDPLSIQSRLLFPCPTHPFLIVQ